MQVPYHSAAFSDVSGRGRLAQDLQLLSANKRNRDRVAASRVPTGSNVNKMTVTWCGRLEL